MIAARSLSRPHAVLFDLDGTLVDTADDLGAALNHVLARYGLPQVTAEHYRPVASHGAKGLLELGFAGQLSRFSFQQLRSELLDYYQKNLTVHSKLFGGAEQFIPLLAEQQIPWGIITNKPYKLAAQMLRQLDGLADCRLMLGGDSLAQRKPSPIPLLVASHLLKVRPLDCWYIGDAERDIEAANRAGMVSVIARYGFIAHSDQPELWQAACQVDSLLDLQHAILNG